MIIRLYGYIMIYVSEYIISLNTIQTIPIEETLCTCATTCTVQTVHFLGQCCWSHSQICVWWCGCMYLMCMCMRTLKIGMHIKKSNIAIYFPTHTHYVQVHKYSYGAKLHIIYIYINIYIYIIHTYIYNHIYI